jgi:cephalosporin-C deacetylase
LGLNDLIVDNPDAFSLGDGVYLHGDKAADGLNSTVATLIRREGDVWYTNRPHNYDYAKWNNGRAETLFPLVSVREVDDAVVENMVLDGNMAENPTPICDAWGAGVLGLRANRLVVRNVHVKNGKLDGISLQTCDDAEVANCLVENVTGMAYHPGSGSRRFHIHDCVARNNGRCGVYYCLCARDGVVEDCLLEGNGEDGISISDRDSGNTNRRLTIRNNGGAGICYRGGDRLDSPHNATFEGCVIENNCSKKRDAEIVLAGEVEGTKIIGARITARAGKPGILIRGEVPGVLLRDNTIKTDGAEAIVDKRPVKGTQVRVSAVRSDALYAAGEKAAFSIRVIHGDGAPVERGSVRVTLTVDGTKDTERMDVPLGKEASVVRATLPAPGFLRCEAAYEADGIKANGIASAGFDPAKITPLTTMPDDFDAFWLAGKKEVEQVPLDMKLELLPKFSDAEVDSYKISFANLDNTRLEGYLCVPKGTKGPFPAFVEVPSSGTGKPEKPWPYYARKGALSLCVEVHPLTLIPEKPQADYREELEKRYPNYWSHGMPDRNKYYFRRAILGVDRAITWLASREDFDRRHLVVYGSSQGGWFAFVMGALNPHVTAIAANVPAACDRTMGTMGTRLAGLTQEQLLEHMRAYAYYDSVNFARRSRADVPAIVSTGFRDTTCPSRGVYAAFNQLAGPKRLVNMVKVGHDISDEFDKFKDSWVAGQLGLGEVVPPAK